MEHLNVADYVADMAASQPEKLAVAMMRGSKIVRISCKELSDNTEAMAYALKEFGIIRGTRVAMMVTPGPELFVLTFALFKIGAILVFVDPGMGLSNVTTCLAEARPGAFIGLTKAHLARIAKGWGRPTVNRLVTVGPRLGWGGTTFDKLLRVGRGHTCKSIEVTPDTLAAINFTSGSTGLAKGAVYTHGMFSEQVRLIREVYHIAPGEIDCSTFPLFALFGAALGMASVVPDMNTSKPGSCNPANIVKAIETFNCTNMFANPAVVLKLGRYCAEQQIKLKSLKRVISCGAPASVPSLKCFVKALDEGIEVHTPYGATEAMPLTDIVSSEIFAETADKSLAGAGVCVGRVNPDVEIRIIKISDTPEPEWRDDLLAAPGTMGEIIVRGKTVSKSYFGREESTRLAKIQDGQTFWHRMGDVGYFDEKGRLWMCGRKAHRVVTAERTYYSIPAEAIFNQSAKIVRSALVGVTLAGAVRPVICIESPAGAKTDKTALTAELLALAAASEYARGIEHVLYYPTVFPVDVRHNAKIFREKLAVWAAEQLQ